MVSMPLPAPASSLAAGVSAVRARFIAVRSSRAIAAWAVRHHSASDSRSGGGFGARRSAAAAAGLQSDEMTEDLERHQAVLGGERDQLGADLVSPGSQARTVKGLHEYAVESEGQQGRVAQAARDPLRFLGRLGPARGACTA